MGLVEADTSEVTSMYYRSWTPSLRDIWPIDVIGFRSDRSRFSSSVEFEVLG